MYDLGRSSVLGTCRASLLRGWKPGAVLEGEGKSRIGDDQAEKTWCKRRRKSEHKLLVPPTISSHHFNIEVVQAMQTYDPTIPTPGAVRFNIDPLPSRNDPLLYFISESGLMRCSQV